MVLKQMPAAASESASPRAYHPIIERPAPNGAWPSDNESSQAEGDKLLAPGQPSVSVKLTLTTELPPTKTSPPPTKMAKMSEQPDAADAMILLMGAKKATSL